MSAVDKKIKQPDAEEPVIPQVGNRYVTVCSEGNQLGGQMTTYATVLGYAWTNGLNPWFDTNKLLGTPGGEVNYEYIFHRLPQELAEQVIPSMPNHVGVVGERFPLQYRGGDLCFCRMPVYPLDYFHSFRSKIREIFAPDERIVEQLRDKYGDLLDDPMTVAVHVRTYHPQYPMHRFLGKEYLERAMSYFSKDHLFVIFSDRIGWCKDNLDLRGRRAIFIEGNNHVQDLYLMSFCKNIIIANSTYSWWAAYLMQTEGGVILAPERWFPNEDPAYRRTFYPSHYTVVRNLLPDPDWNLVNYESNSIAER